jgi:hypothetical protein
MKHLSIQRYILFGVLVSGLLVFSQTILVGAQEHEESALTEETRMLIHDVRGATASFHDLDTALEAGYGKFLDCFKLGEDSGMGQHYVSGDLVGDDVLDPLQPEALVYEPGEDGAMILVAYEYLVFADVWDAEDEGREAPTLYGQEFHLETHVPETPPVWALHLWLWAHNPEGLFADFNPTVFCPESEPAIDMSQS